MYVCRAVCLQIARYICWRDMANDEQSEPDRDSAYGDDYQS